MMTARKSIAQERQEAADDWLRIMLLIKMKEERIAEVQREREGLNGQLKAPAKILYAAVGRNQSEKIYDVQGQGRKLVRVKYTWKTGTDGSISREDTTIDLLEFEKKE